MTLPAAVIIIALLLVAIPVLYGSKFHDSILLGFVLLPGVLLLGIGKVLSSAIAGRGYPRFTLYIAAISMPLTLGLYFLLIPLYDEWGAAAASSVSYALSALLALVFFRRVTKMGFAAPWFPCRRMSPITAGFCTWHELGVPAASDLCFDIEPCCGRSVWPSLPS